LTAAAVNPGKALKRAGRRCHSRLHRLRGGGDEIESRAQLEEEEQVRWAAVMAQHVLGAELPVATLTPGGGGGGSAHNRAANDWGGEAQHVEEVLSPLGAGEAWLKAKYGVAYPRATLEFIEYLRLLASILCARTNLGSAREALAPLEKGGDVAENDRIGSAGAALRAAAALELEISKGGRTS